MQVMRFPTAVTRDPAVDRWLAAQAGELGAMARQWFNAMRRCGPDMRELIHDGCPVACVEDVALGYVNVFTGHMNVGFFLGADLDDPQGLLLGNGKRMRHVKQVPGRSVDEHALQDLIEEAYAAIRRRISS
jgi:hypothetical protein